MQAFSLNQLPKCRLGEAPWWDVKDQKLIFVDIDNFKIYRHDPATNALDVINTSTHVGFAVLDETGKVIAGLRDGIYKLDFDCARQELLARPPMPPETRFNDGICDRRGRLWAGTMSFNAERPATSSLYCLGQKGLHERETCVRVSNGIGWSPDNKIMYYVDTRTAEIRQYDYDIETGTLSGRKTFASIPKEEGRPDGLTVDSQGRILAALYAGSRINIYTPNGALDEVIFLPVPNVTSLTFGAHDLKTLYVTSASSGLTEEQLAVAPESGKLFTVAMQVPGIPETRFQNIPALKIA